MDLALKTTTRYVEDRSWLRGNPLAVQTFSATLDVSAVNASAGAANAYPNGYMPSGFVLGKITSGGLLADYNDSNVDGTETAVGLLFSSVVIGDNVTDVGVSVMETGLVDSTLLPDVGTTTNGGWDAAAATDLDGKIHDRV